MTAMPRNTRGRFDVALLAGLDEPVRRYFTHALADGAPLAPDARLRLRGDIKSAAEQCGGDEQICGDDGDQAEGAGSCARSLGSGAPRRH